MNRHRLAALTRRRLSLRGRLLVASLAMVLVGLVVVDVVTYLALRSFLLGQADARLADEAGTVAHAIRPDGQVDEDDLVAADEGGLIAPGMYVEWRGPGGAVRTFGGRVHARPVLPDPVPVPSGRESPATFRARNSRAGGPDLLVRVERSGSGTQEATTIVAASLDEIDGTLGRLLLTEIAVSAAVLAAVAVSGSLLVRVGLRPLDAIGRTAWEITEGNLSRRVEPADDRTEIGRLGRAVNGMLQRIEAAFAARAASEEALRVSEERLRRFVADASHELRTPLAAIGAYADLLATHALGAHAEDVPRLAGRLGHESRRMGLLVGDLLLLSRLDQGRPLESEPVDLGLVASDAVDAARAVDPARRLTLTASGLVEVAGDRGRLRQVLDNVLANGRHHTPAGTPIEVDVRARAGHAVVRVVDHGPGIDRAAASQVFERFFRLDASRSRTGPADPDGSGRVAGTGLGLAIARSIVEAHRGTLTLSATPGGGATFTVSLPLLAEPVGAVTGDGAGAAT